MMVFVDGSGCIGCGICEGMCPEVFSMVDGISNVIEGVDYTVYKNEVQAAVDSCPVSVISIEE